ncbi:hypothetical protein T4D_3654 [Trichinella pseudospiralis]|uniref:Uncharacterized protein n=1 Tax=Trichinella pseudospiralis TaxID=6337 RepID=A0A0V1F3X9_TRIPS|nr:hypothetical protein T4D_15840 [Trichinella pseudospiralis]KRY80514.1 hypothetical protein T4D_3654 [Trichinella pseudospiralis]
MTTNCSILLKDATSSKHSSRYEDGSSISSYQYSTRGLKIDRDAAAAQKMAS